MGRSASWQSPITENERDDRSTRNENCDTFGGEWRSLTPGMFREEVGTRSEHNDYQAEMVMRAARLLGILGNPKIAGPGRTGWHFPIASVNLAQKGERPLSPLKSSKSITNAMEETKRSLCARRNHGERVMGHPVEFEQRLIQYAGNRRQIIRDAADLGLGCYN